MKVLRQSFLDPADHRPYVIVIGHFQEPFLHEIRARARPAAARDGRRVLTTTGGPLAEPVR